MDGTAAGIKCTLANWTGVAYKIPRMNLISAKREMTSSRVGFYFLFGTSDQNRGEYLFILDRLGREKMERVFSTACRSISAI
jgi:hypothetical protein